ncbi:hypothetical protein ACIGXM_12430 [Kitasatospora sp. NPDC052896]|uniref:hypothetical protein n=1 Tax=Kitasatospora sp. NPDC052896 TaxID=3364061 RepID=UPI0037C6B3FE
MGRKLAGLFGIVVASLALGLGTAAGAVDPHQPAGHRVLAEDKGPTVISPLVR